VIIIKLLYRRWKKPPCFGQVMSQLTLKFIFFSFHKYTSKISNSMLLLSKFFTIKKINILHRFHYVYFHKLLDLFFSILTLKVKYLIFFKNFHQTMLVAEKRLIKSFIQIHESNTYGSGPQTRANPHYASNLDGSTSPFIVVSALIFQQSCPCMIHFSILWRHSDDVDSCS